jgi:hypothetical protein
LANFIEINQPERTTNVGFPPEDAWNKVAMMPKV